MTGSKSSLIERAPIPRASDAAEPVSWGTTLPWSWHVYGRAYRGQTPMVLSTAASRLTVFTPGAFDPIADMAYPQPAAAQTVYWLRFAKGGLPNFGTSDMPISFGGLADALSTGSLRRADPSPPALDRSPATATPAAIPWLAELAAMPPSEFRRPFSGRTRPDPDDDAVREILAASEVASEAQQLRGRPGLTTRE